MSKLDSYENVKNLFCKTARAKEIIAIIGHNPFVLSNGKEHNIYDCRYGNDCKGAHSSQEFIIYKHINDFNKLDKSKYNFLRIYNEIKDIISKDKNSMKGGKIFEEKIKTINELNFIELIQLWHDLACFYRKLSKEVPFKKMNPTSKTHDSGYTFSEEIPKFYLSEAIEEYCWAFYRLTKYCEMWQDFRNKVNKNESVSIHEICIGHLNCKQGVHNLNEILCQDNFLTGVCSCETKEKFENDRDLIKKKIEEKKEQYGNETNKKKKKEIKDKISSLESKLYKHQRSMHYTEEGMIPFNLQLVAYKKQKEEEAETKKIEEERELATPIKKVFKVSLGKK